MGIVDLLKRSFIAFSRFQFVLIFQMLKNRCDANAQLIQYIIDSSAEKKKEKTPRLMITSLARCAIFGQRH